jgi:hypothetical protein
MSDGGLVRSLPLEWDERALAVLLRWQNEENEPQE